MAKTDFFATIDLNQYIFEPGNPFPIGKKEDVDNSLKNELKEQKQLVNQVIIKNPFESTVEATVIHPFGGSFDNIDATKQNEENMADIRNNFEYVILKPNSKKPQHGWKTPEERKSWQEVKDLPDVAVVIPDDYIVIDVDTKEESETLYKIVDTVVKQAGYAASCVMKTDHGLHFWFKKSQDNDIKISSKIRTYLSIEVDPRVGGKGYIVIRRNGKDREWLIGSFEELANVAELPVFLKPDNSTYVKETYGSFLGLEKGSRVNSLFKYYGHLKTAGLSLEDCQNIICCINCFLLAEPLSEEELWHQVLANKDMPDNNQYDRPIERPAQKPIDITLHSTPVKEDIEKRSDDGNNTNKGATDYEFIAKKIVDDYSLLYYDKNFYTYDNGTYKLICGSRKDSTLEIKKLIMAARPGLNMKQKAEVIDNIKIMALAQFDESDDNSNYLALENGVYDTNVHRFTPWEQIEVGRFHFFKRIPITYNPVIDESDVTIQFFNDYRNSLFKDNQSDYLKLLDKITGYLFYRKLTAQKVFFFYGPGGTGKSTYTELLATIIGNDNTCKLSLSRILNDRFALSSLKDNLLNIGDETVTADTIKSVEMIKALATTSSITSEAKYQSAEKSTIFAKHIFCTNGRPRCQDKAFWDRVIVVPFTNVFRNTENNISSDRLHNMMNCETIKSYIFNLAMKGLRELQNSGWDFNITNEMKAAKEDFIPVADNPIEAWLEDDDINEDTISDYDAPDLPKLYQKWCNNNNYRYCGRNKLIKYLKEIFPITTRRRRKNGKTITYYIIDAELDED